MVYKNGIYTVVIYKQITNLTIINYVLQNMIKLHAIFISLF